jgi:histidinol-phosphate aminotransferase
MSIPVTSSKFWSPLVADLEPYVPGEQPQIDGLIKLNTNESPYPPSPRIFSLMTADAIEKLRLYPDPNSNKLKQTIAQYYSTNTNSQINSNQIFVGNGSDEVLALAFLAFFQQNKTILFPDITYSFYPVYCQLFNIEYQTQPLNENYEIDFNIYKKDNGGVIFPNPNAPTAIGKSLNEIEHFLQKNTESVVIVDEAYIDFGGETATALINQYPNLLVIQTLSKSRSLAGIRVGFAMGNSDLITALDRVKNSFNSYPIDRLAEAVTIAAFEDVNYFEECRQKIIATRKWTITELTKLGFEILPSQANFVLASPPEGNAAAAAQRLRDNKILVRYFNLPRINQFLRITIGTDAQMQRLIEVLKAS